MQCKLYYELSRSLGFALSQLASHVTQNEQPHHKMLEFEISTLILFSLPIITYRIVAAGFAYFSEQCYSNAEIRRYV